MLSFVEVGTDNGVTVFRFEQFVFDRIPQKLLFRMAADEDTEAKDYPIGTRIEVPFDLAEELRARLVEEQNKRAQYA